MTAKFNIDWLLAKVEQEAKSKAIYQLNNKELNILVQHVADAAIEAERFRCQQIALHLNAIEVANAIEPQPKMSRRGRK